MKHKSVNLMLANLDDLMAEDIADYAVFNTIDNDAAKSRNLIELIIAYSKSEQAKFYTADEVRDIITNVQKEAVGGKLRGPDFYLTK